MPRSKNPTANAPMRTPEQGVAPKSPFSKFFERGLPSGGEDRSASYANPRILDVVGIVPADGPLNPARRTGERKRYCAFRRHHRARARRDGKDPPRGRGLPPAHRGLGGTRVRRGENPRLPLRETRGAPLGGSDPHRAPH